MTPDRRAHPRFPLVLAVQYSDRDTVLDHTENLSAGGLFVRTERDFAVGDRVVLVVSFPALPDPLEVEVEVVRTREGSPAGPAGVAVRVPPDRPGDLRKLADVAQQVGPTRRAEPEVRILLVEDNALVASMYSAALARLSGADGLPTLGIEVAADGAAAFERLLSPPRIDVVVTDVFMPVLSGISLVEKLRAEPALADLPVVVISSGGDRERERLAALGVATFLRKPVSYLDVANAIRKLLGTSLAAPYRCPLPPLGAAGPRG